MMKENSDLKKEVEEIEVNMTQAAAQVNVYGRNNVQKFICSMGATPLLLKRPSTTYSE